MKPESDLLLQGRWISTSDIQFIRDLLNSHPDWSRTHLSKELCTHWDWRRETGALKDIACRSLLRRLDQLGHIQLPKGDTETIVLQGVRLINQCSTPKKLLRANLKNSIP